MTDREIFRKNLNNLMSMTKVKQVDIAKYAEVSYQTVSAWVKGRGYPRAEAMEKLCKFFGVKQSILTENHDNKQDNESILLDRYRMMSAQGQEKLLERSAELVKLYPKREKKHGKAEETF